MYGVRNDTNPNDPHARALCDRCGANKQHRKLTMQMEYRGRRLASTGWLVCPRCLDTPFTADIPPILKPDPIPVRRPRPDDGYGNTTISIGTGGKPVVSS